MKDHFYLKPLLAAMLLIVACHKDSAFDNAFDLASELYIPPFNPAKGILIDDFDDGKDPNLLGFFDREFDSLGLANITVSYDNQRENVLRGAGHSLRIGFDLSQGRVPVGGYVHALACDTCSLSRGFFNLANLKLDTLTFWMSTTSQQINFEVALKDSADNESKPKVLIQHYLIPDARWRKAKIPISALRPGKKGGPVDFQRLKEISLGFASYLENTVSNGAIYIDEIAFER